MVKTYTGTVTRCEKLVSDGDKEVYECQVEFPRKLTPQIIDIGASIGVIPQNMREDVEKVI